jgi:hypothetical protein
MRSAVLALAVLAWGCPLVLAEAPLTAADRAFFEKKVRPLLIERCYQCHSNQAKKLRGGLHLDSRAALLAGGDSGPAVVAGKPDQSLLLQAVRYTDPLLQMPPKGKLADREVAVLAEWIRRGVPFPGTDSSTKTERTIDTVKGRQFWSFRPLRASPPPTSHNADWVRQRIDAYILARLEEHGLTPSPPATKRILIRRAYFDLIGLPPTPADVQAFLADDSPDAYEQLIDRLLSSPLHGERWARFWLELARYCDIAEPWAKRQAPAHVYRDWVMQAVNEDLPYDQFVQRQLAADLMPEAKPEDRAALGFLGLSPVYWKELKLDNSVIKTVVAEEWEERIDTLGRTFLGLTIACARCHDHKFDPITQEDYYALAGVFASIRQTDRPLLPEPEASQVQQARKRIVDLQEEIAQLEKKKPVPADLATQIANRKAEIAQIRKDTPHLDAPLAPAVAEASLHVLADGPHRTRLVYTPNQPQNVALQIRGSPTNLGPVIPRRFLALFSRGQPTPFQENSGRRELAQAIVTEAGPLAARVIVNRVWKHHFGKGLVETPSDFGFQGERPSHPQLLDDLASRFVQHGWSLKWLHREILLSATYQQASMPRERQQAVDPDNRLLARMNRRRLEVEAWRDAMLAVSGTLTLQQGGPAQDLGDASNTRRTIYGVIKRRELDDLLRLYDVSDATTHSPARTPTTTPLQQLFVLNSPFMQQQSTALAQRLKGEAQSLEDRVHRAYQLLYGRAPSAREISLARAFLVAGKSEVAGGDDLWAAYAQALLGSNEFLFID